MAVAGGGVPAKRVGIYARQLRGVGLSHNVDSSVILTPEQAAKYLIDTGGSCYIESVGDATKQLQKLLEDAGLVDKFHTSGEWLEWVKQR